MNDRDEDIDETRADCVSRFLRENPSWSRKEAEEYFGGEEEE